MILVTMATQLSPSFLSRLVSISVVLVTTALTGCVGDSVWPDQPIFHCNNDAAVTTDNDGSTASETEITQPIPSTIVVSMCRTCTADSECGTNGVCLELTPQQHPGIRTCVPTCTMEGTECGTGEHSAVCQMWYANDEFHPVCVPDDLCTTE